MKTSSGKRLVCFLSLLCSGVFSAHAEKLISLDNWQVSGFATLGYADTDKYEDRLFRRNVYQDSFKVRDNPYLLDSRFGLQFNAELNANWEFVAQAVLKHQFGTSVWDRFDMAFFRYQASNEWQVSLGRQPFDMFFLSDHIDVGYSYDWVRPPSEFYGSVPFDSFDGVKLTREWGDFDSAWRWNLSIGNIESKIELDAFEKKNEMPELGEDGFDTVEANPIYNTELSWQSNEWHLRANFALLDFNQDFDGGPEFDQFVDAVAPIWPSLRQARSDFNASNQLRYLAVGASWHKGDWKIQSEISNSDADFAHFQGTRAYFHVAKRLGNFQPFVTLGYAHDDSEFKYTLPEQGREIPILVQLEQDLYESYASLKQNQSSIAVGLRWDFDTKKALKVQCDRYYFRADSGSVHGQIGDLSGGSDHRSWCSASYDWVF